MKMILAKGARSLYPHFPYSYDKLRTIFAEVGVDHRTFSHGETPTDLYIKVLPVKEPPTDTQLNSLKDALNRTYTNARFEIV